MEVSIKNSPTGDILLTPDAGGLPRPPGRPGLVPAFTGTLDEVADLGVGIYNRNSQVVPTSEFVGLRRNMRLRSLATVGAG